MKKIPRNLDDKEMLKGYKEEESVTDIFLRKEVREKEERTAAIAEQEEGLSMAGLTPPLIEKLSKELLQLRLELFAAGTKNCNKWKIRRNGHAVEIIAE
ncbi:hypothetical protein TAMA11512_11700 [Selenomonas sp. TAMA-11512]|uniref:hypothetical protein n=1 Tax=Selenomonas sp. TAMA-11512 TaxID=3095337 RepID=UPI003092E5FD|nr:hypothetical protein TAMA11512_11700 [Selenomonas sp. TAMA-11512]